VKRRREDQAPGHAEASCSQAFYAGHGRDDQEYTPDFALNTVIDGVAACKRAGAKDLAGCVERATRLDAILPVAPR
jgi:hypothetical protein